MKAWKILENHEELQHILAKEHMTICAAAYLVKHGNQCNGVCDGCELCCNLRECFNILTSEFRTDWRKVPVDTPILVRDNRKDKWTKAHFAKFEDGYVYSFLLGQTSWTSGSMENWQYAILAEDEQNG